MGVVELDQPFLFERFQKLYHKKRVSARLLQDEVRERFDLRWIAVKCVADKEREIMERERPDRQPLDPSPFCFQSVQRSNQRVRGIDLIVTVSADQEQALNGRARQQRLKKIERGRVRPLQVIERNNQGMVSAREGSYEVLEDKPKTVLGLRRPQRDGRGLRP